PDVLVNLGNLLHRHSLGPAAEWAFRKALFINPDHPEANYHLALLFEEREDLENALLFYRKTIHEDPEFADAHFNLGRLLDMRGDLLGAKKHWRQYLLLEPEGKWSQDVRRWLGEE
ncbi:MAG: tetratricopeptide repeat protein, partial [Syntrophales bacterium]|nr:tetratricopeptide repeat protein [Syntrophales bacterium]